MSEQVAVPGLPAYLQKLVEQMPTVNADAESMATSSMSIPRVSLRAKKFRWSENGEEVFVETESHAIILAVEPGPGRMVKTYYEGTYNPGDSSPPTCSSSDGVIPDSWVSNKQNDYCATCPKNVFGSATSRKGKPSKACRDSKRLWLARPDDISGTVYGMGVPVTSLKELSALGQQLKSFGAPISAAVILMTMDDDESFPTLFFKVVGWLKEDLGNIAIARSEKKDWTGALKGNPQISGPPRTAAIAQPQAQQTQQVAQPQAQPAAQPQAEKVIQGEVVKDGEKLSADEALSKWTS